MIICIWQVWKQPESVTCKACQLVRQGIREEPNIRNRFKFAGSLSRTIKSPVCKINQMSNHASNSHLSQTIHSAGHLVHALLHAAALSVDSCSLREMLRKAKQCAWCQMLCFLFALLYADMLDCLLPSLPHPLIGLLYFYDLILLTRSHLVASCPVQYASGVAI